MRDAEKADILAKHGDAFGDLSWTAFAMGYRDAMKSMYPDAEAMFGQDADATRLVIRYLAIEDLIRGDY